MSKEKSDAQKYLKDLLRDFSTAMLVTQAGDVLRARPMAIADVDDDDVLYFFTDIDSAKVIEVRSRPGSQVILQDARRQVSLSGTVRVLKDRSLIKRLWSEPMKVWFPKGEDDPSIAVLAFDAAEGEYWDHSGINGVKYLFRAAKAYATGTRPTNDVSEHGKATL